MRAGGIAPRLMQRSLAIVQMEGSMHWRKVGVRDLSVALSGSVKLNGPCSSMSGSAKLIVSAQAMYFVESGVVVGLNSIRSRYSTTPSLAVW